VQLPYLSMHLDEWANLDDLMAILASKTFNDVRSNLKGVARCVALLNLQPGWRIMPKWREHTTLVYWVTRNRTNFETNTCRWRSIKFRAL